MSEKVRIFALAALLGLLREITVLARISGEAENAAGLHAGRSGRQVMPYGPGSMTAEITGYIGDTYIMEDTNLKGQACADGCMPGNTARDMLRKEIDGRFPGRWSAEDMETILDGMDRGILPMEFTGIEGDLWLALSRARKEGEPCEGAERLFKEIHAELGVAEAPSESQEGGEPVISGNGISRVQQEKEKLFKKYTYEMFETFSRKNRDYTAKDGLGSAFDITYDMFGPVAPAVRFMDKVLRYVSLTSGKEQMVMDEKVEDTLMDLANYALLTRMKMEEDERRG